MVVSDPVTHSEPGENFLVGRGSDKSQGRDWKIKSHHATPRSTGGIMKHVIWICTQSFVSKTSSFFSLLLKIINEQAERLGNLRGKNGLVCDLFSEKERQKFRACSIDRPPRIFRLSFTFFLCQALNYFTEWINLSHIDSESLDLWVGFFFPFFHSYPCPRSVIRNFRM